MCWLTRPVVARFKVTKDDYHSFIRRYTAYRIKDISDQRKRVGTCLLEHCWHSRQSKDDVVSVDNAQRDTPCHRLVTWQTGTRFSDVSPSSVPGWQREIFVHPHLPVVPRCNLVRGLLLMREGGGGVRGGGGGGRKGGEGGGGGDCSGPCQSPSTVYSRWRAAARFETGRRLAH